jgi:hypothetical protein
MSKKSSKFTMPVSKTGTWKGQLTVTVQDGDITSIIHEDLKGKKSEVTDLIYEMAPELWSDIEDAKDHHLAPADPDYTLDMQEAD